MRISELRIGGTVLCRVVQLLKYRIEILKSIDGIQKITVRTSQLAYKFYEKQGFTLKEIQRDYWAKGFDMYSMEYNGH